MKPYCLTLTIVALTGCSGRFVELEVDPNSRGASGGSSSHPGAGGAGSADPGAAGGSRTWPAEPVGGQRPIELTRGGFADSLSTFHDGKRDDGAIEEACKARGEAFFVYEPDQCLAASACLEACDPTSSATATISFQAKGEGASSYETTAECRTALGGKEGRADLSFLVFPCDERAECPPELVCVETELGPACFVRDVPWAAGCTDAYCLRAEEPRPSPGERERCDGSVHCCAGLICEEGTCKAP